MVLELIAISSDDRIMSISVSLILLWYGGLLERDEVGIKQGLEAYSFGRGTSLSCFLKKLLRWLPKNHGLGLPRSTISSSKGEWSNIPIGRSVWFSANNASRSSYFALHHRILVRPPFPLLLASCSPRPHRLRHHQVLKDHQTGTPRLQWM